MMWLFRLDFTTRIPFIYTFLQVVVNLILCGIIAGLAAALSGAFILPSVAGNELRQSIGLALVGVGKSLSGYVPPRPPVDISSACHMP